jgi:hypothetical protein
MTFRHPDIGQFYDRVMAFKADGLTDGERPVYALMDAYGWFRLIEGDQAPQSSGNHRTPLISRATSGITKLV